MITNEDLNETFNTGYDAGYDAGYREGYEKGNTAVTDHPNPNRMIVCSQCGNKRCPKATDHNLDCTRSNEPGQKGSSWENYQIPTKKENE